MTTRILSFICCIFLFTSCDDTFLKELETHRSLEGNWKSTILQINNETIVFDMDLILKADHTFTMYASVLGKQHTRYLEYTWTGQWNSLESNDTFELSYKDDFGIIGYYLNESMNQEVYLLEMDEEQLVLRSREKEAQFKLILQKQG